MSHLEQDCVASPASVSLMGGGGSNPLRMAPRPGEGQSPMRSRPRMPLAEEAAWAAGALPIVEARHAAQGDGVGGRDGPTGAGLQAADPAEESPEPADPGPPGEGTAPTILAGKADGAAPGPLAPIPGENGPSGVLTTEALAGPTTGQSDGGAPAAAEPRSAPSTDGAVAPTSGAGGPEAQATLGAPPVPAEGPRPGVPDFAAEASPDRAPAAADGAPADGAPADAVAALASPVLASPFHATDLPAGGGHGDPGKDAEHADFEALAAIADNPPAGSGGLFTAIASGDWSDPATWADGRVPTVTDGFVVIPEGIVVTYDAMGTTRLAMVRVDGTLNFATDHDTRLIVDTLLVDTTGTLTIGTHDQPVAAGVTAGIHFSDSRFIDRVDHVAGDLDNDPKQLSLGLVSHGAVEIHGAAKTEHLEVASAPMAGATTIRLAAAPVGWQVGDTILLTGTHHVARGSEAIDPTNPTAWQTEDETFTITAINGRTVTLDHPVRHDHDTPGPEFAASVANLTRNVEFRSLQPDDTATRGHVMLMHNDHVSVENAAFIDLGRTDKSRDLDDFEMVSDTRTSLDTDDRLTENGVDVKADAADITNARGRYPLHLHRVGTDPGSVPAEVSGNVVIGSPGWGLVQHDSAADLTDNVVYGAFGAGFVSETGNETGTWTNNLAVKIPGRVPDGEEDAEVEKNQSFNHDFGITGTGYWFQGRILDAVGNVSANTGGAGFFYRANGEDDIDSFADNLDRPEIALGQETIENRQTPLALFQDNESYGGEYGLFIVGANTPRLGNDGRSVIDGFTAWEFGFTGLRVQYSAHYTLRDLTLIGAGPTDTEARLGLVLGVSTLDITVDGAVISGVNAGVFTVDTFTVATQALLWGAADPARNAAMTDFGHHFVDVFIDPAVKTGFRPNLIEGRPAPITYEVIDGATLDPHATLSVQLDDASLFASWSGNGRTGPRSATVTGTKTDHLGTTRFPHAEEALTFDEAAIQDHLADIGYHTVGARRFILVDTLYSDRLTGESRTLTHTIELDAAWQVPEGAHDLGALPDFTTATRFDVLARTDAGGHPVLVPTPRSNAVHYAAGLRNAGAPDVGLTTGTFLDEAFTVAAGGQVRAGDGADTLTGGAGRDTLLGGHGDDRVDGGADDDRLFGDAGDDAIKGGVGLDTLGGDEGDDALQGGAGADSLDGGAGDDTLSGDDPAIAGADTLSGGAGADVLSGFDANDSLSGGADADSLDGGLADDLLTGEAGGDSLAGGDGRDTLRGDEDGDTLAGGLASDSLDGGAANDLVQGGEGGDTILGGAGADTLEGGGGDDRIDGGDGTDTVRYAGATAGVAVSLALGSAGAGAGADTLLGLEGLEGSAFADTLTGGATPESLLGGAGDDWIEGGLGNDWIEGGAGTDTARYAGATAGVAVSLDRQGANQYTRSAGLDALFGFEALEGSAFADTLAGAATADTLTGAGGDDSLDGAAGADLLAGGLGADLLLGGDGADTLRGEAANDRLEGGLGNDRLEGGDGIDTIRYGAAAGAVVASLALGGGGTATGAAGTDTLLGAESLEGSTFADTLGSDAGSHSLAGADGDDRLEDRGGTDVLDGGAGTDLVSYALAGAAVTVSLIIRGAQATGGGGTDTLLVIEGLEGSAFADTLAGNLLANTLLGGGGADSLTAGDGPDTIEAGDGDDSVVGGLGDDSLSGGAGIDTLIYLGAIAGVSVSLGLQGIAQATGGAGIDRASGFEAVIGTGYGDTLTGSTGHNRIEGGGGDDRLSGGLGNDTLIGGLGTDSLTGGAGADTFLFAPISGIKRITDFTDQDALSFEGFGQGFNTVAEILATGREQSGPQGTETMLRIVSPGSTVPTSIILEGVRLASLDASDFGLISP